MFANQFFYIMGVDYAGADISSIFQPAIPVWTVLLAIITRVEKPPSLKSLQGWAKISGITFAVGGAVTMLTAKLTDSSTKTSSSSSSKDSNHADLKTILGIIFLFVNTICMAIYILIQKHYIFNRPNLRWSQYPVSVTAWCYFFGTLCMAMASFYYVGKCPHIGACKDDPWHVPKEEAIPLVYAIFITSALCYMLITWGNMHISPTVVTAFWPLQVPVAVVASYFFLNEHLSALDYGGGGLIIVGLLLVVYSNWYSEKLQKKAGDPLVFGRTEQERKRLISSKTFHNTHEDDDDDDDDVLKPKLFPTVNVQ
jgi:drug/metabolite transporter (DMT)-like permease